MAARTSHNNKPVEATEKPEVGAIPSGYRVRRNRYDPDAKIFHFVNTAARYLTVKIVTYDDDDAETLELVAEATKDNYGPYIQFKDWKFETTSQPIARLIMKRAAAGDLKQVFPDAEKQFSRCRYCDATFSMTRKGQEEMGLHITSNHADEVLAYIDDQMAAVAAAESASQEAVA